MKHSELIIPTQNLSMTADQFTWYVERKDDEVSSIETSQRCGQPMFIQQLIMPAFSSSSLNELKLSTN